MIRPVAQSESGRAVYGFTLRGIAVLAVGAGFILTAVVLGVIALAFSANSTTDRILFACHESNRRHQEAIPEVVALLKGTPPKTTAEAATQAEVLAALAPGGREPKTQAARVELRQVQTFVQILAPRYDCAKRLEALT